MGVVISTFNDEKDKLGKNFLLSDKQKEWLKEKGKLFSVSPLKNELEHRNKCREVVRKVVSG